MQKFIDLFVRRPVFASMIILAMVVVGAAAYSRLGVDRFPSVDLPTVSVRTTLPGASPEISESELAERIEEVVNTVAGLDELRAISGSGTSNVMATFDLSRNVDVAAQDVRDKVATVVRRLPDEADPPTVAKFDNDSQPVITFVLSGDKSVRELTEIADKVVKKKLETGEGVGEVAIVGGANRTINIDVDADKLASYGIPISAISEAVRRENTEVPGGNLSGQETERSLRTMGRLIEPRQFGEIVLKKSDAGAQVRIKDVAAVTDGTAEQRSVARLNGKPAVSLDVRRQTGANTIATIESVKALSRELDGALPPGVKLEILRDQSNYIYAALHEINHHLVVGSILACLVVLAFTRSWRSMVIAGVAIPASVVSTFAVMWVLDFTLNSVTMLALVLMVGIVIDDAIVVLENIFRFIEEKKMDAMEAARLATGEIATAVLATTLSLAIIFVPVSFMSSISGRFLYQFGITAAVAVMVSLLVSFVLTPTLSARMLASEAAHHGEKSSASRGGFYGYIDRAYTAMLHFVMRHRLLTSAVALGVAASSIPLFSIVQQGYLPQGKDEAEIQVQISAPEEISFPAMNDLVKQVESDLMKRPEVTAVLATAGGGFLGNVNSGDIYVRIPPHEERYPSFTRFFKELFKGTPLNTFKNNYTQTDVMQAIRAEFRKYAAKGVRVSARNYAGFNIGGGNFDIDFSISGADRTIMAKLADELLERGETIGGFANLDTTLKLNKPELLVQPDRERAQDLGIAAQDLGQALRLMIGGEEEVSEYRDRQMGENYDIRLRLAPNYRRDVNQVPQILLAGSGGRLIELSNIAKVEQVNNAARLERVDRARDARVRGSIAPGYSLAGQTAALQGEWAKMDVPPGYKLTVRGTGREFERTYREFIFAFLLSIVFMYMILASQYENLVHPITILLSLPLSVPFALLSLILAGEQLNLYSALGILVLFGVVKKNSILQIDHMNHLRHLGRERYEAVIEGNRDRLRPILMTTIALVAGMAPMAIGTGPGAEERRAVAIAVIGGQTLSLLLTLLVTPVAYTLLDDLGLKLRRRKRAPVFAKEPGLAQG